MNEPNDSNNFYNNTNNSFYNFDSFVDPSMLLPDDLGSFGGSSELEILDSIPSLPTEIPSIQGNPEMMTTTASNHSAPSPSSAIKGPGSLYDQLTCPSSPSLANSPSLYPYGHHYTMGSPSSLMMSMTPNMNASSGDPSWMHSNRPRRRRSSYASPSLVPQTLPQSQYGMMMASPSQLGLGFNPMNMPYGNPMMMSPHMYGHPYMMAPPMSPMNVTVKLPMAPLTPTNYANNENNSGLMKIPLVLPCHLQQQSTQQTQNSAAPNVSKLQIVTSSAMSSGVPSRCSSIAPNSSISSRSLSQSQQQNWFTEMSATKDKFLSDVESVDFNNVTVLELKQILRKFGLNSTGKKVQLVDRITEISNFLKVEGRKRAKIEISDNKEDGPVALSCSASIVSSHSSQHSAAAV